jgi:nicotinamidase-related amidase
MASLPLITPSDCAVVLVDYQAGLAFAAGSADRQGIRSAALALAKTAVARGARRGRWRPSFLSVCSRC